MGWTGIILAAGGSTRMGQHKAMLDWSGEPIVVKHCRAIMNAGGEVIVALGAERERIRSALPPDVTVSINTDWATTQMAHTLRGALEGVRGGALITPVDVPPVPVDVAIRLTQCPYPAVACHRGVDGHPVWVDAECTRTALENETLAACLVTAKRIEVNWPGCVRSWNTPSEWSSQSPA